MKCKICGLEGKTKNGVCWDCLNETLKEWSETKQNKKHLKKAIEEKCEKDEE